MVVKIAGSVVCYDIKKPGEEWSYSDSTSTQIIYKSNLAENQCFNPNEGEYFDCGTPYNVAITGMPQIVQSTNGNIIVVWAMLHSVNAPLGDIDYADQALYVAEYNVGSYHFVG